MAFNRRDALKAVGLGLTIGAATMADTGGAAASQAALLPPTAQHLADLTTRLARLPRRRDFKAVPMILDTPEQWDHEALAEVIGYQGGPKQVWDNSDIAGPWLNAMRNALNTQIWGFKHPEFLVVSATHGTAHLALYDQAAWEKYQIAKLAGDRYASNTLILETKAGLADLQDYQDPSGAFSPQDNTIAALQRRGVVFLSCHNAIWEQAGTLLQRGQNPDRLSHEALAADLTNHLIPGAILTPGAVGTIVELQQAGFFYAR